jgi:hypothetical protein
VTVDVEVISQSDDDLLDLLGELSGRGEDQSLGLFLGGVDLGISMMECVELGDEVCGVDDRV